MASNKKFPFVGLDLMTSGLLIKHSLSSGGSRISQKEWPQPLSLVRKPIIWQGCAVFVPKTA